VGTALEYDSPQIRALPRWPSYVPVFDIAGNMQLKVNIGALHFTGGIGDGAVSIDSAIAHDTTGQPLEVTCAVTLFHPMQTLACEHSDLPYNATVVASVISEVEKFDGTKIVIDTRATSSLNETVDFTFIAPLTNPGSMSFVMDYSNGAQCDAESAGLAGVSFKVGPNAPNSFTMYAIDIDAVSPNTPAGDSQALGDWLVQQPSITIEGNAAGGPFWGLRVITCEGDINSTNYLVPAGQLPASINTGLSSDGCSPQLTQNQ
jgi:hypothetical protein